MANETASVPTDLTAKAFTRSGYHFAGWNTLPTAAAPPPPTAPATPLTPTSPSTLSKFGVGWRTGPLAYRNAFRQRQGRRWRLLRSDRRSCSEGSERRGRRRNPRIAGGPGGPGWRFYSRRSAIAFA